MQSYQAIDADGHIGEDEPKIIEYMDAPYRGFRPGAGSLVPRDGWDRRFGGKLGSRADKPQEWLDALAEGGLECTYVYPTGGLFEGFIKDPDYAVAYCRAYNTWLSKEMCQPRDRLRGLALLPPQDPEEAAKELRRAVVDLHLAGGMFCADGDHLLGHKRYDAVYQAAAAVDAPIAVHASGSHLGGGGVDMFPKFIQAHTVSHPFGILRQFTSLMYEGAFEKFPTVRFGFLECGGTWAPWWLDRMDEEFELRGEIEAPLLRRKPSQYVHGEGNIFFGCEAEERLLGPVLSLLGDNIIMYASDFPHWDGGYPENLFQMQRREDLTDSQRYGVLRGAAERFYGPAR